MFVVISLHMIFMFMRNYQDFYFKEDISKMPLNKMGNFHFIIYLSTYSVFFPDIIYKE